MRTRQNWLLFLTAFAIGCGGTSGSSQPDAAADLTADLPRYDAGHDAVLDLVFLDLTKDIPSLDQGWPDIVPETVPDIPDVTEESIEETLAEIDIFDTGELDIPPDVPPGFPFGAPCDNDADCEDGVCLALGIGSICTTSCDEECPEQWECWALDDQELCVPPAILYCKTCDPALVPKMDGIVCAHNDNGYFNLLTCDDEGLCPLNLSCSDDAETPVCLPPSGTCLCLPGEEGKQLDCTIANDFGECQGFRPCLEDGVGACTGQVPGVETCNNQDDDCDGLVDETAANCAPPFCKQEGTLFYMTPAQTCIEGQCTDGPQVPCGLSGCDKIGAFGVCLTDCQTDVQCSVDAWCQDGACQPKAADGLPCSASNQCDSGHCAKGICCQAGDCCFTAGFCPSQYWGDPQCDDPEVCQGHRNDAACINNMCQEGPVVPDDSGCDENTMASECGAYPPAFCSGLEKQSLPVCSGECLTDANCDPGFHCDKTCKPDLEDGYSCDEDTDCMSGHCQSGICCLEGLCCMDDADCLELFSSPPQCLDPVSCQGTRQDAACLDHVCTTVPDVTDDSACAGGAPALECGALADVWCNGDEVQAPPVCLDACESDSQCDQGHACIGQQCVEKKNDGHACDADNVCASGHCANGYCCAGGDCCKTTQDCPAKYTVPPICTQPGECQGARMDVTCENHMCGSVGPLDDDSACTQAVVAQACAPYPDQKCTGQPVQAPPTCASGCTADEQCGPQAHCDEVCKTDLPEGYSCDENSDCASGHCANNYCCQTGDCCITVADCPAGYATEPTCTNTQQCQGLRIDALCQDFQCLSTPSISDDSGCTEQTLALDCKEYGKHLCTGQKDQQVPTCPSSCSQDSQCLSGYHCDGTCLKNLGPGAQCDENSDCTSGHCANGFCCTSGDCCITPGDCPPEYTAAPVCEDQITCQGFRVEPTCDLFVCGSEDIADDSACTQDILVDDCGPYLGITCTGGVQQTPPVCPALCQVDEDCDADSHCDGVCTPDFTNGDACDEDTDCQSGHCSNGFCCAKGVCCVEATHCPPTFTKPSECTSHPTCQGHRVDAVCTGFQCKSVQADDDTGCNAKVLANDCGPNPDIYCSGDPAQPMPVCSAACQLEEECGDGWHCDVICVKDVANGFSCDEDTDCQSAHCANGFCCASGDCCQFNIHCPESYSSPPVCTDEPNCQGQRFDKSCGDHSCVAAEVADDTACGADLVANQCGLYVDRLCNGQLYQNPPVCPETCKWDSQCDPDAHCDDVCTADLADGEACNENSDCQSKHCENGFCCAAGSCCFLATDCPALFAKQPLCDDNATCQGHRVDPLCEDAMCDSIQVEDDSGCSATVKADECDFFMPVFCDGQPEQTQPPCPQECTDDSQCDADAHCDDQCVPDLADGDECDEDSDCTSDHCANGFCCTQGDCCNQPVDCPAWYSQPAACVTQSKCQGQRIDATCENFTCGLLPVLDDSACTPAVLALECSAFLPIQCTGEPDQTPPVCPTTCTADEQCDPGAHCDNTCVGDQPDGKPCNEDSDCQSGHCALNVCCAAGDCCITANACPAKYKQYPVCDESQTCQGHRVDKTCVDFTCGSAQVQDDSGCGWWTTADTCGPYNSVTCNGSVDQQTPDCPAFCTADSDCDADAHCDDACKPDQPDGAACDENTDCQSGHCQNDFCCQAGDCCALSANCPASYESPPQCTSPETCQGARQESACQAYRCVSVETPDDTACTGQDPALICQPYLPKFCDGKQDQAPPACPQSCVVDEECLASAHCDDAACTADLADGSSCDENSDCQSGHCENGFCCVAGQCCFDAPDCPAQFSDPHQCLDTTTCQGQRSDATCTNFMCGTQVIEDDSACTQQSLVSLCGPFASVFCTGAVNQIAPACPTTCTFDEQCDPDAHCDSACVYDLADGQTCNEASDCISGHCDNAFCCAAGECCAQLANCPGDYTIAPQCLDPATCQGERGDPTCIDSICGTATIQDDSACTAQTLANDCAFYLDLWCNGQAEQTAPECPTQCATDDICDPNAHCDDTCKADLPTGSVCDESSDCITDHCANNFCCASGDCCLQDSHCPSSYTQAPKCLDVGSCQGTRKDPVCLLNSQCTSATVADDSGCTAQTEANPCGFFKSVYCNGDPVQSSPSCPLVCFSDNDCDPDAHCVDLTCKP